MEYRRLGNTGLEVSRICLGCMSYGQSDRGTHPWSLDEESSRPFFEQALELGINFFDTANVYSLGTSEEYLGRALRDLDVRRSEVVIATKVNGRMRKGPNGAGLSRKVIMTEVDDSLRRLGTDYIDLYQIHRWDPKTPIEETMEALNDLVRSGKVRYIGASSMWTWQFATAQHTAELNGWTKFVSMQNHYNLLMREEEREMLPYCEATGVGVIPWSPLARGRLARTWDTSTGRSDTDAFGSGLYGRDVTEQSDRDVVGAVAEIAAGRGTSMARVALAWVLSHPGVTAPIVGATRAAHLDDAVAALEIELSDDEVQRLTAPYIPHQPAGF
jgi:aryl-alcohol dehydrogenase-like predicted oxidoreductase